MASPVDILRSLPLDRLKELVEAAPRKVREELFRSVGIRTKSSSFSLKAAQKTARIERLASVLQQGTEPSGDAAEEVIRHHLAQHSSLLGDALDQFDVPHNNGMTDHDLGFFQDLEPARAAALRAELEKRHDPADVDLYLRYVGVNPD